MAALLCAKTQSSDAALFLGATAWMLTAPLGFVALGGTLMLAGVLYVAWIFAAGASDPAPPGAPVHKFKNKEEAMAAYHRGEIALRDHVEFEHAG